MTAYFDNFANLVRAVDCAHWKAAEHLCDLEEQLVMDVSVCSELPGFPEEIRDTIDRVIMVSGVYQRPRSLGPCDFETAEQHREKVRALGSDLHDVFHDLARLRAGWSDSPTMGVRMLAARAEERRNDDGAALTLFRKILPFLLEKTR